MPALPRTARYNVSVSCHASVSSPFLSLDSREAQETEGTRLKIKRLHHFSFFLSLSVRPLLPATATSRDSTPPHIRGAVARPLIYLSLLTPQPCQVSWLEQRVPSTDLTYRAQLGMASRGSANCAMAMRMVSVASNGKWYADWGISGRELGW